MGGRGPPVSGGFEPSPESTASGCAQTAVPPMPASSGFARRSLFFCTDLCQCLQRCALRRMPIRLNQLPAVTRLAALSAALRPCTPSATARRRRQLLATGAAFSGRSEERRVGKEGGYGG